MTLFEVLVGLLLSAWVVAVAHRGITYLFDTLDQVDSTRLSLEREANLRRSLTALLTSIEVNGKGSSLFDGSPQRVVFSTWFRDERGWWIQGSINIQLVGTQIVVSSAVLRPLAMVDGFTSLEFDYLVGFGAGEQWLRNWRSSERPPSAIRIRMGRETSVDTLLIPTGSRG